MKRRREEAEEEEGVLSKRAGRARQGAGSPHSLRAYPHIVVVDAPLPPCDLPRRGKWVPFASVTGAVPLCAFSALA